MGERAIRVLLCDDSASFRALLRITLDAEPGIEVVGEAADGEAAVRAAVVHAPDVVLLDLTMPLHDGIGAIALLRERAPGARIVALSGFSAEQMAQRALDAGAHAYLQKSHEVGAVRDAVRDAATRAP